MTLIKEDHQFSLVQTWIAQARPISLHGSFFLHTCCYFDLLTQALWFFLLLLIYSTRFHIPLTLRPSIYTKWVQQYDALLYLKSHLDYWFQIKIQSSQSKHANLIKKYVEQRGQQIMHAVFCWRQGTWQITSIYQKLLILRMINIGNKLVRLSTRLLHKVIKNFIKHHFEN